MDSRHCAHHVLLHAWDSTQVQWPCLVRRTCSRFDGACCAGNVGVANDFVCKLDCKSGYAEVASLANGQLLPPPGIFAPPYAINVGLAQIPIITRVGSSPSAERMR